MIHSVGIQSSNSGTTHTFTPQERLESKPAGDTTLKDQVELRSSKDAFAGIDPSTVRWDDATMDSTLSMIRTGSGLGAHGNLDPARVFGLLGEAGMATA